MLEQLYQPFRHWSDNSPVWLMSDTHFLDVSCQLMDPNWPSPDVVCAYLADHIHRNDTVVHLGDVGSLDVWDSIWRPGRRPHEVIVTGNHDPGVTELARHFDEVYDGPIMVAPRLMLSHEPVVGLDWCFDIHGHDHDPRHVGGPRDLNIASNVFGYRLLTLRDFLRAGHLSRVPSIHRETIDNATARKAARQGLRR